MNRRSSAESRKKILDAALIIFSDYGYRGTSMRMIAGRAGISVGGLYLYFASKEELYLTMLKHRFEDLFVQLEEVVSSVKDPVDAIAQYITISVEYAKRHRETILAQSREQGFSFGIDIKKKFFRKQRRLIEAIIRRGVDSGCFGDCDTKEATKIVVSTLRGFVLSIVIDPENLFQPGECVRFMLQGLIKREAQ